MINDVSDLVGLSFYLLLVPMKISQPPHNQLLLLVLAHIVFLPILDGFQITQIVNGIHGPLTENISPRGSGGRKLWAVNVRKKNVCVCVFVSWTTTHPSCTCTRERN